MLGSSAAMTASGTLSLMMSSLLKLAASCELITVIDSTAVNATAAATVTACFSTATTAETCWSLAVAAAHSTVPIV